MGERTGRAITCRHERERESPVGDTHAGFARGACGTRCGVQADLAWFNGACADRDALPSLSQFALTSASVTLPFQLQCSVVVVVVVVVGVGVRSEKKALKDITCSAVRLGWFLGCAN